jgi:hypothetical protein
LKENDLPLHGIVNGTITIIYFFFAALVFKVGGSIATAGFSSVAYSSSSYESSCSGSF